MTIDEWRAEASKRYGADPLKWKFRCPVCGYVASVQDWKDAGADSGAVAFSCVGRWKTTGRDAFTKSGEGPCNYAGGGLIHLNPIKVVQPDGTTQEVFEFA